MKLLLPLFFLAVTPAAALVPPVALARPAVHPCVRCASAAMCSPAQPAARIGKRQRALALLRRPVQALAQPIRSAGNVKAATRMASVLFLAAASLFVRSSGPVHAAVASAAPSSSVDSKKAGAVMSFVFIGGTIGFSVYQANKDQEEEDERIAAENKRLEQLQSDYQVRSSDAVPSFFPSPRPRVHQPHPAPCAPPQVDKSVFKDEDLLASLRKRMSDKKGDGEGGEGGDPPSGDDKPGNSDGRGKPDRPKSPSGGGSSAVLEPPSEKPATPAEPSVGSAEDVERLKRMFGLGNDSDK
jgi:hypothetical protein